MSSLLIIFLSVSIIKKTIFNNISVSVEHILIINNSLTSHATICESCVTPFSPCRQADTCIQSPGSQRRFQTSSEDDTILRSEQPAAESHWSRLCVGQLRQFKPNLGEQLPAPQSWAEQRGGKPGRAVQHNERIQCRHHTQCSFFGQHIATIDCGFISQQAWTDVLYFICDHILCADWILCKLFSLCHLKSRSWLHW